MEYELTAGGALGTRLPVGTKRTCDMCSASDLDKFVDGKIKRGPWANMCLSCHKGLGVGLGLGKGQLYELVVTE